jgi:hypothetical protein
VKFADKIENEDKFALYRWDHEEPTAKDISKVALGKRGVPESVQNLD